jgi:hypothetical protein
VPNANLSRILMTLLTAIVAALLTYWLTYFGSMVLISSINEELGLPDETYPSLDVYCEADAELLASGRMHDPPLKPLQILAEKLRVADRKPNRAKAQFQTICSAHQAFFQLAQWRNSKSRTSAPGILPCQDCDAVKSDAKPELPPSANSRVETDRVGTLQCNAAPIHDLDWMEPRCVLERIHSVRPEREGDSFWSKLARRVVMASATASGLQGNMYVFNHARTGKYTGDPNEVTWGSAKSQGQSPSAEASDIQDLQLALGRLDKLVLPRIKQIENSVWIQRFFLQALNNWMQAGMVWLGIWAGLIYLWDLIAAGRLKLNPTPLVAVMAGEYPLGIDNPLPTALPPPAAPNVLRTSFSSELRNVMDEILARWQVYGRVVADTLYEWIPIIGFIGTVVGMIGAIDAIGEVIQADQGPELYTAMGGVTSQLMLAFYTTFIGLVLSAILSLLRRYCIAMECSAVEKAAAILRE